MWSGELPPSALMSTNAAGSAFGSNRRRRSTDDEHFSVLHHTGKRAHYGIRRSRPNSWHQWLAAGVLKFALDDRNPARWEAQAEAAMTVRGREEPLQSLRQAERYSAL